MQDQILEEGSAMWIYYKLSHRIEGLQDTLSEQRDRIEELELEVQRLNSIVDTW